ncbi:MAG: hypothetical protein V1765_02075 [bacterium]
MKILWLNNQGLSFMEIMVSISIIIVVLSLTVVNYKGANKRTEIIIWADKLVSDIRLMENNALAVKTFNDDSTRNLWGIYFNTSNAETTGHYVLYNDENGNQIFDSGETYRDIILPNHIIVEKVEGEYAANTFEPITECSVALIPPDPAIKIINHDNFNRSYSQIIITLLDTINGSTKTVTINFFGLVEVVS